ncbi:MAG: hypothetical protein ACREFX_14835 [Opitutaceae bacterium]
MKTILPDRTEPAELDARISEPSKLVDALLAALAAIPWDVPQYVRTKKRPVKLHLVFEEQGFECSSEELPDGSWRTAVRHPAGNVVSV